MLGHLCTLVVMLIDPLAKAFVLFCWCMCCEFGPGSSRRGGLGRPGPGSASRRKRDLLSRKSFKQERAHGVSALDNEEGQEGDRDGASHRGLSLPMSTAGVDEPVLLRPMAVDVSVGSGGSGGSGGGGGGGGGTSPKSIDRSSPFRSSSIDAWTSGGLRSGGRYSPGGGMRGSPSSPLATSGGYRPVSTNDAV